MEAGLIAKVKPDLDRRSARRQAGKLRDRMQESVEDLSVGSAVDEDVFEWVEEAEQHTERVAEHASETGSSISRMSDAMDTFDMSALEGLDDGDFAMDIIEGGTGPAAPGDDESPLIDRLTGRLDDLIDEQRQAKTRTGKVAQGMAGASKKMGAMGGAIGRMGGMLATGAAAVGIAGLGLLALAGIWKGIESMAEHSPLLSQVVSMFGLALSLFFRPFASALGRVLLPAAGAMLRLAAGFNRVFADQGLLVALGWLATQIVTGLARALIGVLMWLGSGIISLLSLIVDLFVLPFRAIMGLLGFVLAPLAAFTLLAIEWLQDPLVDFVGDLAIGALEGMIDLGQFVKELVWDRFIVDLVWSTFIVDLVWSTFIVGLVWNLFIQRLVWGAFVRSLQWTRWLAELWWSQFITALEWTRWIGQLWWSQFVTAIDWTRWIASLWWSQFVRSLRWARFIARLTWSSFVSALSWVSYVGRLTWSTFVPDLRWSRFVDNIPGLARGGTVTNTTVTAVGEREPEVVVPHSKLGGFVSRMNQGMSPHSAIPGSVPKLAAGGVVTDSVLAMVGEGRESEAILPLSKLESMLQSPDMGDVSGGQQRISIDIDVDAGGEENVDAVADAIADALGGKLDAIEGSVDDLARRVMRNGMNGPIQITADEKVIAEIDRRGKDKYKKSREMTR